MRLFSIVPALFLVAWSASGQMDSKVWTAGQGWEHVSQDGTLMPASAGQTLRIAPRSSGFRALEPRMQIAVSKPFNDEDVYRVQLSARAVDATLEHSTALKVLLCKTSKQGRPGPVFSCGPVLSSDWETYSAPFRVPGDIDPNEVSLFLLHGWGGETIEVRDVCIENLGSELPLKAYARSGRWYAGQELDAPWREQAEAMIEKNRKGDFHLTVIDAQGEPVKGARIIAEQQRHAYRFGTAVNSLLYRWIAPGAESDPMLQAEFEAYRKESGRQDLSFSQRKAEVQKYFTVLKADFNYAVLENALKWQAWSGEWGGFRKGDTLDLIHWLNANDIAVKAHTFVWPGWQNVPSYLKNMADRPQALSRTINAHITDIGSALNGKVVAADVLNEVFNNHDIVDVLGDEVMAEWFKQAREVMPDTQLNINDFQLMANGGRWREKLDFYDNLAGRLLRDGAPLGGLGFQSHFRHSYLTEPQRIWELCDRFGRHGVPLICSEFDVDLADQTLQANYTHDFLTAWFAHPATTTFLFWGFWQDSHWLPYGALYDRDWQMKPIAQTYRDLVYGQWWSGWEETQTDEDGAARVRGFLGDYRITAYANDREVVLENITLKKSGTVLNIRL